MTDSEESFPVKEEKQNGLERVLECFPEMSWYHFGLFAYCYYGYMGVATAVAGNIFYQYRPSEISCDYGDVSDEYALLASQNLTGEDALCTFYEPTGCEREEFGNASTWDGDTLEQCFEQKELAECTHFKYSDSNFNKTLVSEYNLVCGKKTMPLIFIMLFNIGLMVGPIVAGKVSDKLGRTKTISFGALACVSLNMLIGVTDLGAWGYGIMRIFTVICSLVLALPNMVYPSEVLTPKYRSMGAMMVVATALGAGILIVVAIAWFIRDWRTLHIFASLVNVPSIFAPLLMPESYRWLYQNKKFDEAEAALLHMSKKAGGTVTQKILDEIKEEILEKQNSGTEETEISVEETLGQNATIKRTALTLTFCQFIRGLIQFYLLYTVASLGGDFWVNNIINNIIGFPACFVSVWMMNNYSFGRKGAFIFGLACCAISQLLRVGSLIINSSLCAMMASYLGLFGAMGSMAVGQAYTSELFPTTVRIKATAVIYTGAMGGSFLVPIWMVLDSYIPWLATSINFTLMSLGAFMCFKLPETFGNPMTETISDFEQIYENKKTADEPDSEELLLKKAENN